MLPFELISPSGLLEYKGLFLKVEVRIEQYNILKTSRITYHTKN